MATAEAEEAAAPLTLGAATERLKALAALMRSDDGAQAMGSPRRAVLPSSGSGPANGRCRHSTVPYSLPQVPASTLR